MHRSLLPAILGLLLAWPCLSTRGVPPASGRARGRGPRHELCVRTSRSHGCGNLPAATMAARLIRGGSFAATPTGTPPPPPPPPPGTEAATTTAVAAPAMGSTSEEVAAAAAAAVPEETTAVTSAINSNSNSNSNNSSSSSSSSRSGGLAHNARILGYFALWYALNVWYNIVNKRVLNALALPASVAVAQLGIGSLWVGTQWLIGLRERPGKLTAEGARRLTPVACFHGGGQLATVLSLGAGAVSFTHVVKAMEPFFSALVAAAWFRQVFRWQVYASLLPVVAGVSLAVAKEINFSWVSFLAAMASNLLFACRSNFSKALMTRPPVQGGASLSSANLYGLVTLTAFAIFAPVAVVTGWGKWRPAWDLAMKNGHQGKALALSVLLSGSAHYLNNEVMYLALGSVHPTTLAVGNTMKRVFIVAASLIVFKTPISRMGMVGSVIAVGGVLVYSLTKQHFDVLERKKATEKQQQ